MTAHSSSRVVICSVCGWECAKYKKLKKHLRKEHSDYQIVQCPLCDYVTVQTKEMKRHKKTMHLTEKYGCQCCHFYTKKWTKWKHHLKNLHKTEKSDLAIEHVLDSKPSKRMSSLVEDNNIITGMSILDSRDSFVKCDSEKDNAISERNNAISLRDKMKWQTVFYEPDVKSGTLSTCEIELKSSISNPVTQALKSDHLEGIELSQSCLIFQCRKCSYECGTYMKLIQHYKKNHQVKNLLQCPHCKFQFLHIEDMKRHKKDVHRYEKMSCRDCDFSSKKWKVWADHVEIAHKPAAGDERENNQPNCLKLFYPLKTFRCLMCSYKCGFYKMLIKHYKKKHEGCELFECPFCEYVTIKINQMRRHKRTLHSYERISCSVCSFSTKKWKKWAVHRDIEHGKRKTGVTEASCSNSADLNLSVQNSANSIKVFSSDSLTGPDNKIIMWESHKIDGNDHKIFVSETLYHSTKSESLEANIIYNEMRSAEEGMKKTENVQLLNSSPEAESLGKNKDSKLNSIKMSNGNSLLHSDMAKLFYGEKYITIDNKNPLTDTVKLYGLRRRVSSDIKPFQCPLCKFSTKDKYYLKYHVTLHSSIRPHSCTFCPKAFVTQRQLQKHIRVHIKEHKCHFCEYATDSKLKLHYHILAHLNIKPFKCTECDYATSFSTSMINHERIHTGERPFVCDICNMCFQRKFILKKHMTRVHFLDS